MSDPMTNPEIEDVLSSIRRLVSEDSRTVRRQEPAAMGKLVLTPALRVAEPVEEVSEAPEAEADDAPVAEAGAAEADAREDQAADAGADSGADATGMDAVAYDMGAEAFEFSRRSPLRQPAAGPYGLGAAEAEAETEAEDDPAAEAELAEPQAFGAPAHEPAQEDDEPPFLTARGKSLEERIAELEAAVGAQADEWEPDGSELAAGRPVDEREIPVRAPEAPGIETAFTDLGAEQASEAERWDAAAEEIEAGEAEAESAEEDVAEAEPAEEEAAEEGFSDVADAEADEEPTAEAEAAEEAHTADDASDTDNEDEPQAEPDLETAVEWGRHGVAFATFHRGRLSERDEAPSDARAEAYGAGADNLAGDDDLWLDAEPELETDDAAETGQRGEGFDLADDAILDEEALREMVAQIVRDELQGVLGERITRNVRRLVRREVQRALTLKDFE